MDLKRLRYFSTIVEQGSISKAAELLCMAQPPLSKRLQELEEEIGAELVVRTGKRLEPTEAGQYLYLRACEILRAVEDARQKTAAIASTERRVLRVGVSYLFLRYYMPLMRELYIRNPRAEIAISVADSSYLEELLQHHQIDVALMQRPRNPEGYGLIDLPPVGLKALVSTALMPEPPPGPVSLDVIGRLPLISLKRVEGFGSYETILDHLRKAGVHPDVKMQVSDPSIVIEMLESGIAAAAFIPASEVVPSRSGLFHAVEISPNLLVFNPAAARLSTSLDLPEVLEIISEWMAEEASWSAH